jgi:hypothetical protein
LGATPKDLPAFYQRRHIGRVRPFVSLLFGMFLGCSSSPLVLPRRPTFAIQGQIVAQTRPRGTLFRDEVERAIQAGLGYFLQQVDVRAVTRADDSGRRVFVGFEILSLRPAMDWLMFDFAPGDVVTKVDGVSIEHYDTVIPMFEGLAAKDRFEVSLIRAGEPKTVVVSIVRRANMASKSTSRSSATKTSTATSQ